MRHKPIMSYLHTGVRDAWKGEEQWVTYENRPLFSYGRRDMRAHMRKAGYLPYKTDKFTMLDMHARWFIWPVVITPVVANAWWWRGLRGLGEAGVLRTTVSVGVTTRFRDLRPVPPWRWKETRRAARG